MHHGEGVGALPHPLDARLALALEAGLALPPSGRILVIRPRAGAMLGALPRGRVHVVQGFKPDHDAFAALGFDVGTAPDGRGADADPEGCDGEARPYAAALVCLPRARAHARALIAQAAGRLPEGAPLAVDGPKTDGVDAVLREVRTRLDRLGDAPGHVPGHAGAIGGVIAKAHGKLFWMASPGAGAFAGWAGPSEGAEAGVGAGGDGSGAGGFGEGGFATAVAGFSACAVDRGSALLGLALPARLPARVVDLGAGWGYLSAQALAREGVEEVHLVEAEHDALHAARRNLRDPRARFHWADACAFEPAAPFDLAIMNPPFHRGRDADPGIGQGFIRAAARCLSPRGALWCVANRHLPYERALAEAFAETREAGGDSAYKILVASRPLAARSSGRRRRVA